MAETLLQIGGVQIPAGAGRGINQSYEQISSGQVIRDINGVLHDLTSPSHRKWRTTISCRDQSAPTLSDLWIGDEVEVSCIAPFRQPVVSGAVVLSRDPVSGSVQAFDSAGKPVAATVSGRDVSTPGAAYVFFRPVLTMRIVEKSEDMDEWGAEVGWSVSLEEV